MYRDFYAAWPTLPLVGFACFALAFALILLRTFAIKTRRDFDADAALPLDDHEVKP